MPVGRVLTRLGLLPWGREGPSVLPAPPRHGPLGALLGGLRLPADVLVALAYTAREFPHLVQDVRSLVNDSARILHANDAETLAEILGGLARIASPEGSLTRLLEEGADLAAARTARERANVDEP